MRRSTMTAGMQLAYRPLSQNRCGAYCMTCLKPSDEEQMVEEMRNAVKVLVRCHGAEELRTFAFEADWDYEDLKRAMQRCAWFDPMSHEGVGGVPNNGVLNDDDL